MRLLRVLIPLLCAAFFPACSSGSGGSGGGGGGGINQTIQNLAACSGDRAENFFAFFDQVQAVVQAGLNDPTNPPAGLTITNLQPPTNPIGFHWDLDADLNQDMTTDATISGDATFFTAGTPNPVPGIPMAGSLTGGGMSSPWTLMPQGAGTLTGGGAFILTFDNDSGTQFHIDAQNGSITDGTCALNYSFMGLAFDTVANGAYPTGTVNFTLADGTDGWDGTIAFDGTSVASVSTTFQTLTVTFDIDLMTGVVSNVLAS